MGSLSLCLSDEDETIHYWWIVDFLWICLGKPCRDRATNTKAAYRFSEKRTNTTFKNIFNANRAITDIKKAKETD